MPRKKKSKTPSFDVRALRKKLGVSQEGLGKMLGASPNSVYNWERGTVPNDASLAKLRDLASGKVKVSVPAARKPGRPPTKKGTASTSTAGPIDVRALRKKLGLSQDAFGKRIGASGNTVYNWERGAAPRSKFLAKLKALAGQKVEAAAPSVRNGPPSPKARGRPAAIKGDVPITYANRASVHVSNGEARIRFGLTLPGEGVRAVADIVVPDDVLDRLRG